MGLWAKRDANNNTIDQIAIKEVKFPTDPERSTGEIHPRLYPHLSREAVIHQDLNRKNADVFPKLRAYKFIKASMGNTRKVPPFPASARFYMEYAAHGDLEQLKTRYRIWDQHLPELFLWHVFYRLAVAGDALRAPPERNNKWAFAELRDQRLAGMEPGEIDDAPGRTTRRIRGLASGRQPELGLTDDADDEDPDLRQRFAHVFCLHADQKPGNVFLLDNNRIFDPEAAEDPDNPDYPLAKLGDLGMARYTSWDDNLNPFLFWTRGTKGFRGPVSLTGEGAAMYHSVNLGVYG